MSSITLLRRLIRETLKEQGWVPGRWNPTSGNPVNKEDEERLGNHGELDIPLEDEEDLV